MTLLHIANPEDQTPAIQDIFENFTNLVGEVPKPLQMLSVSPKLFMLHSDQINYFSNHSKLSFALLTCIRYLTAKRMNYTACIEFNKTLLEKQGMTIDHINAMENDTSSAPLEEKEMALLAFVINGLEQDTTEQEMIHLRRQGWSDQDIFDATSHCFSMIPMGKMMQLFKI